MDMKLSENKTLSKDLQALPQLAMPKDIFAEIQTDLHQSQTKKHRLLSFVSVAVALIMAIMFLNQKQSIDDKDETIQQLVKRTMILEQIVANETPQYTLSGSVITEKIANMELWLEKLDKDIAKTKDKKVLSELMAAKVDILGNLVMLQRKINQTPNYQKIKPYII